MQITAEPKNKLMDFINTKFPDAVKSDSGIYNKYTNVRDEYHSLKHGVALRDISNHGVLRFTGNDTLEFLNRVSTNAVKDLTDSSHIPTLFINEKGRFIDRTTLLRFGDDVMMVSESQSVNKLKIWINRFIVTENIKIEDVNDRWALFELIGPQVSSYLTIIGGDEINALNETNIVTVDVDSIKFYLLKKVLPGGIIKYWILTYSVIADKVLEYLIDQKSVFDFSVVGEDAYEMFRIENGLPEAPNEINDSFNPHEANLISEVSFTKGCYIGQEVIARLDTYNKVQRNLRGVIFSKKIITDGEMTIVDDKKNEIGTVTSVASSDDLNKVIGLAYVRNNTDGKSSKYLAVNSNGETEIALTNLPIKE